MKIKIDKLELFKRINALNLTTHYEREKHRSDIYFDTDIGCFFVVRHQVEEGNKYSGKIMVPQHAVAAAQISTESVPQHQPIGTPPEKDTPSGNKRKHRTEDTAKSAIADAAAARAAAKTAE